MKYLTKFRFLSALLAALAGLLIAGCDQNSPGSDTVHHLAPKTPEKLKFFEVPG